MGECIMKEASDFLVVGEKKAPAGLANEFNLSAQPFSSPNNIVQMGICYRGPSE